MRWIFISPHFDDAALSCGGLIYELGQKGERVEIWTICAGYPEPGRLSEFAARTHAIWGTGEGRETVDLRRGEDRAAATALGAVVQHFSNLDCIYRTDPAGNFIYPESVFDPPRPADASLPVRIAAELAPNLVPGDRIICPLAVGNHVDHVLTFKAVGLLRRPLIYYADFPYLLRFPEQLAILTQGMRSDLHRISEQGLAAWQSSVAAYRSQLPQLFGNEAGMRQQIRGYWELYRGIHLWLPAN
jgi:LmbE family N-acetylglucosaminyl deacetylase